jgi:hypothetical protein
VRDCCILFSARGGDLDCAFAVCDHSRAGGSLWSLSLCGNGGCGRGLGCYLESNAFPVRTAWVGRLLDPRGGAGGDGVDVGRLAADQTTHFCVDARPIFQHCQLPTARSLPPFRHFLEFAECFGADVMFDAFGVDRCGGGADADRN